MEELQWGFLEEVDFFVRKKIKNKVTCRHFRSITLSRQVMKPQIIFLFIKLLIILLLITIMKIIQISFLTIILIIIIFVLPVQIRHL